MAVGDVTVSLINTSTRPCYKFDGIDDKIEIPHNANQIYPSLRGETGFSISAWFNPIAISDVLWDSIVHKANGVDGEAGYALTVESTGINITFLINLNGAQEVVSNILNNWHFLAGTAIADGTQPDTHMFFDGTAYNYTGFNNDFTTLTSTNPLTFGKSGYDASQFFKGYIADVILWKGVLTAAEAAKLYRGEEIDREIIGRWKLNGNTLDSTGHVNGTATGAVPITHEQNVSTEFRTRRVTANDKYFVCPIGQGHEIITAHIQEAP